MFLGENVDQMDWSYQTVLVTGAGGFIGSHLTERLADLGAHTRAFVRYNSIGTSGWLDHSPEKDGIEVIFGDIRDRETLQRAAEGVDIIFHLASLIGIPYSYYAPLSYVRTNVEGTLNVLQCALDAEVRLVVHTSTSEVYGTARYVPINEDHPLQGQSPYSASKIAADKLAEAYHRSFGLPLVTIRPFNTYGPRQSARAVVPTIVVQALTQPSVHLGSLEPTRDFNYVADTVQAFITIPECPEAIGQVINVGSGEERSIAEMARTILDICGRDIPIVSDGERVRPEESEVGRLCADTSKARNLLGWQSRYKLEEGLAKTIEWIEANLDRYRPSVYML